MTRDARPETYRRRALVALILGAGASTLLSTAMPAFAAWLWLLGLALLGAATVLAVISWRHRGPIE